MRIPFQRLVFLLLLSVFVAAPFSAQEGSSSAAPAPPPSIDDKFVHDHFGKEFTLMPEFPAMVADMNGDGHLDIVHGPARKQSGPPVIFLGDGQGSWTQWKEARFPSLAYDYGDVEVAVEYI